MVAAIHITDVYSAISIFQSGEYESEQMLGDKCINLYDPAKAKSNSPISERSGCIIDFEWTSSAIASGALDVSQCSFDELYMEHAFSNAPGNAWRWRIRAPYTGNDLIMTGITFSPVVIKKTFMDQEKHKSSPLISKFCKYFNLRSKAEKEADWVINRLNDINAELTRTKGKIIKVTVGS